jgi:superfamily II DNA or RNA helicase
MKNEAPPMPFPESATMAEKIRFFEALPSAFQDILEVLAFFDCPMPVTDLAAALDAHEISSGKALSGWGTPRRLSPDLNKNLELLKNEGLLEQTHNGFQGTPALATPAIAALLKKNRFAIFYGCFVQHYSPQFFPRTSQRPHDSTYYRRQLQVTFWVNEPHQFANLIREYKRTLSSQDDVLLGFASFLEVLDPCFFPFLIPGNVLVLARCFLQLFIETGWGNDSLMEQIPVYAHQTKAPYPELLASIAAEYLWLRGKLGETRELVSNRQFPLNHSIHGFIAFWEGRFAEALTSFQLSLRATGGALRRNKDVFPGFANLLYPLTLLKDGSPAALQEALRFARLLSDGCPLLPIFLVERFVAFLESRAGGQTIIDPPQISTPRSESAVLSAFFQILFNSWDFPVKNQDRETLAQSLIELAPRDHVWFVDEMALLLEKLGGIIPKAVFPLIEKRKKRALVSLAALFAPRPAWEAALDTLETLVAAEELPTQKVTRPKGRLVWDIGMSQQKAYYQIYVEAREQGILKSGKWSRGRLLNPAALQVPGSFQTFYSEADKRALTILARGSRDPEANPPAKILSELVGHPYLFSMESGGRPIQLKRLEPTLVVQETNGMLEIQVRPEFKKTECPLIRESTGTFRLFFFTPEQEKIAEILARKPVFPLVAKERVFKLLSGLSRTIVVHSSVEGEFAHDSETIRADSRIRLRLSPDESGAKAEAIVKPFGDEGPAFVPGKGGTEVFAVVAGRRLHTVRDLAGEVQQVVKLEEDCFTLAGISGGTFTKVFPTPMEALDMLLQLESVKDRLPLEFPQDWKPPEVRTAGLSQLKISLNHEKDWFALDGELRIDENLVIRMDQLLEGLHLSRGRFLKIDDKRFLALTDEFRQRLDELAALSSKVGKKRGFHASLVPMADDILAEVPGTIFDQHWKNLVKRWKEADQMDFALPTTLTAELRPYQADAFTWLARLAHLGLGACLADDMGLGKTIEALAVLLQRARLGPALVVAPTSVCLNWTTEVMRFAPTLRAKVFGPGNREELLKGLEAYDLLICSYGLLHQAGELISAVSWSTIVLDEAQAIKNVMTQRSQAAMNLQGSFKIIMTGTPIENHLGELWNLFRFINPGLLGPMERFNEDFAIPIQKLGDKRAQSRLKRIVQPFILRRTKSQVLQELPSRTEITLQVELSDREQALYEALRRQAVVKLEKQEGPNGHRHIQILAELMKLRRFCCNPRLVTPGTDVTGAKLEVLSGLTRELLENRHKALIFSQFVDHLSIVREFFDREGFSYQYLDGRTPPKDRQKAVEAFQDGQGDFFLISLKAGGLGLNLTAADYVIHLDPWWNPAVEDQASDRAHRIGQRRPVTIYRLVTTNTIEQKIVDLHRTKRDLADGLLDGTDLAGRISTDDLMSLLRDTMG